MKIFQFFATGVLVLALAGSAAAETNTEAEAVSAAAGLNWEAVSGKNAASIDFESYQRNIDDIFYVALMTSPTLDYSINSIIIELNRRIAENPSDVRPLISLGHVYRILAQPSEANHFYQKALELDPENFHLNLFSAMVQAKSQSFENALEKLEDAIRIHPLDVYPWMTKGKILMFLERNHEAAESFEKALEIQPENRHAAFALSLLYQKTGNFSRAQELLEKLKASNPEDLFVLYHLGALDLVNREPAKALTHWEVIFQEGVRDTYFLFNLAVAYKESGQPEKAERILEHLRFFMPRELDVELLMADVYRQMDRLAEAESAYRGVLAENPANLAAAIGLAQMLEKQSGREAEREQILREASEASRKERDLQAAAQAIEENPFGFILPDVKEA